MHAVDIRAQKQDEERTAQEQPATGAVHAAFWSREVVANQFGFALGSHKFASFCFF